MRAVAVCGLLRYAGRCGMRAVAVCGLLRYAGCCGMRVAGPHGAGRSKLTKIEKTP